MASCGGACRFCSVAQAEFARWCWSRAVCGLLRGCRPYPRHSPCPDPSFLMPPAVDGRRRRCPAFTPVTSRATKACAIQPTPPTVEEIVAVMRIAGDSLHGRRLRALIVVT